MQLSATYTYTHIYSLQSWSLKSEHTSQLYTVYYGSSAPFHSALDRMVLNLQTSKQNLPCSAALIYTHAHTHTHGTSERMNEREQTRCQRPGVSHRETLTVIMQQKIITAGLEVTGRLPVQIPQKVRARWLCCVTTASVMTQQHIHPRWKW